ncbi:MAG: DUF721 domain-containing protein [Acidimicrobiia bacterium]|nr:DUF721 domain-containing protein [Acidimicrobiia bacterium]
MPWEPLPDDRPAGPAPLRAGLDRVVRRLGGPSADVASGVFGRWDEMVGETVAANSRPVAVRGTTLVLAVSDPAWATQLRFLEADIVARLVEELGASSIESIEVRVRPSPSR